jgi:hypothetical protein
MIDISNPAIGICAALTILLVLIAGFAMGHDEADTGISIPGGLIMVGMVGWILVNLIGFIVKAWP